MVQRVLEQQSLICSTLLEQKRLDLLPKEEEFGVLEELVNVLKPFKKVTAQVSAELYVTSSAIERLKPFKEVTTQVSANFMLPVLQFIPSFAI